MLWRIIGSKRDEVRGEWRKLHNEELNNLHSSPNIIRVIQMRRMQWAGHVVTMGERRGVYSVLVGENLRERDHLGDPGVNGRIILRWIFSKWDVVVGTGWSWHRIGTGGGHFLTAVMNLRVPYNGGGEGTS